MASQYLTIQEMPLYGVAIPILAAYNDLELTTAIEIASSEADTYLIGRYAIPLTGYTAALKKHVCSAVLKHLLDITGRSPLGDDSLIDANYAAALAFYKALRDSEQQLPPTDAPTSPGAGAPCATSEEPRGW